MNNNEIDYNTFFEKAPVGLVVISSATVLKAVNNYMFSAFSLTPQQIEGKRFGNVFKCKMITTKKGLCGTCTECEACPFRLAIASVLSQGKAFSNAVIEHEFLVNGNTVKKNFSVSACPIEKGKAYEAVLSFNDITEQKEYERLLTKRLMLDLYTGVVNKATLIDILQRPFENAETVTIVMIDFDNFKALNDTYGHTMGDRILNIFGAAANSIIDGENIAGRFGGEEFMLILKDFSAEQTFNVLKKIHDTFVDSSESETGLKVTFSAGANTFDSKKLEHMHIDAIINIVDKRLYSAKADGKNRLFDGKDFRCF